MNHYMIKSKPGLRFPDPKVYFSATCIVKSTLKVSLCYRAVSQISLSLRYTLTKEDFYEWPEALIRSP